MVKEEAAEASDDDEDDEGVSCGARIRYRFAGVDGRRARTLGTGGCISPARTIERMPATTFDPSNTTLISKCDVDVAGMGEAEADCELELDGSNRGPSY